MSDNTATTATPAVETSAALPTADAKGPPKPAAPPKLTGAEIKKQKQAEKAARRAQVQQVKQVGAAAPSVRIVKESKTPITAGQQHKVDGQKGGNPKRRGSNAADAKSLPLRNAISKATVAAAATHLPKEEDKTVEFFRHLYKPRITTISSTMKDVHPTVLALGLQMKNYSICGSCARLAATLQAFKKAMEYPQVIESYNTPQGAALNRHFTPHVLSHQIDYISSCRPLSVSMGNAIRWLKLEISNVDISTSDADSKKLLSDAIDGYVKEKVVMAGQVIIKAAVSKIRDGDVIMTYAKSGVIQGTLAQAHAEGKKFRVIVVDSRPLFEGRHLAEALAKIGVEVKYCLINGLAHNIQDVTKVFLGAHAMMSNGVLLSRVGAALVAMEAHSADKPVLVLCETVKFTEKVALDSIIINEVAPPEQLVIPGGPLENWKDVKNLQLLNPMYDVTPAVWLRMVITENGSVPPTSVPVLHRLVNEGQ